MTRYRGIRWRADVGFEARCDDCARRHDGNTIYWPLTTEFWNVRAGMARCRACWLVLHRRTKQQAYRADPELARARNRAKYAANRRVILIKRRVYYEENAETIKAKARARRLKAAA